MPTNDEQTVDGGLARMISNHALTGLGTGDPEADAFLCSNATAVLMGVLFDQRIRAEVAFCGPYKLWQRLGHLDLKKIAALDPEEFLRVFSEPPAIHRFANVMAGRTQEFSDLLVKEYSGDARNIWADGAPLEVIQKRVSKIKGFGPGKLKKLQPAMTLFGHSLGT